MHNTPLVSIVIPSYNRAAVLSKSVRSVLGQSFTDLELIVVDDGSTDATKAEMEAIGDPRLRYVYQDNAGACAARNRGAALARGAYIAFHDSDDLWHPDKLEKQLRTLEETGADIVVCKLRMRRPDGTAILYPKRVGEGFVSAADDLFGIGTQTVLARRDVLETTPFDPRFPRYQDLEWVYRALGRYRLYCLDQALVDYAVSADSISRDPKKMYAALRMLEERYPQLRRECPALSMHIVKNLLANWTAFRPVAEGQERAYWALACRFYPGLFRYLRSRRQTVNNNSHR